MAKIDHNEFTRVPKLWGHEIWIANNEKYCGKLLHLDEGKSCSWHFHQLKEEHFYVQSGTIKIVFGNSDDREEATTEILQAGDGFHVPIGLRHQMTAVDGPADMFEFSTQHFDSDSHRIAR